MRIGELAAELGLNPKTIRYYEAIGLLRPPRRTPAGYRLYDAADRERLQFILKAKTVGLTLEEIKLVLDVRSRGQQPCTHVLALLDQKLAAVDEQLRALSEFRRELIALRTEAADTMHAEACVCGIIEHHAAGLSDGQAEPIGPVRSAGQGPHSRQRSVARGLEMPARQTRVAWPGFQGSVFR
jgi:DNA-binding transcriptional MerR regulator